MTRIRKRLTYANVMSSLALFIALGGATAFAASELAKNSVGTKQLKKGAVTAAKIKDDAVTGAKIKDGEVTGREINLDTLGTVPRAVRATSAARADSAALADLAARAESAATADTASRAENAKALDGQITFSVRLGFGQQRTVATHGAVSIVASCVRGVQDVAKLVYETSVNGAVAAGRTDHPGNAPDEFLNVNTPFNERTLLDQTAEFGETLVGDEFEFFDEDDAGFVVGPDGKGLVINPDGTILAINYGGPGCRIAGVVNTIAI